MQKKFEKLPGLSNVSGKYTKRCLDEAYPFTKNPVFFRGVGSIPPSSSSCFPASSVTRDRETPRSIYLRQTDVTKSINCKRNPSQQNQSYHSSRSDFGFRNSSNVSSPSWPSSLSSALPEQRALPSNFLSKPAMVSRSKMHGDIVKSSSSGSVSALNSKPMGIILATPLSPRPKVPDRVISRGQCVYGTNNSNTSSLRTHHTGPVVGKDICILESSPKTVSSAAERFPTKHVSTVNRPSVLVRPFSLPIPSQHNERNINFESPVQLPTPVRSPPHEMVHPTVVSSQSFQSLHSDFVNKQKRVVNRNMMHSEDSLMDGWHLNRNLNYVFPNTSTSVSIQGGRPTLSTFPKPQSNQTCSGCTLPCDILSYSSNLSSSTEHQVQFAHPASDSVSCANLSGLPGPQYTQRALEQYLSEIISENLISDRNTASYASGSNQINPEEFLSSKESYDHLLDLQCRGSNKSSDLQKRLHPLCFLEKRIEKTLNYLRNGDQPDRGEQSINSASFKMSSSTSAMSPVTGETAVPGLRRPRKFSQFPYDETVCSDTMADSNYSDHAVGMLEQFSEPELMYLLKAVQDLITLQGVERIENSEGSSSKLTHTSYGEQLDFCPQPSDNSALGRPSSHGRTAPTGSRTSSRSDSSVRTISLEEKPSPCFGATGETLKDGDHSATAYMHKNLPLGFQHFKRYLDNKFGPDHPMRFAQTSKVTIPSTLSDEASSLPLSLQPYNSIVPNGTDIAVRQPSVAFVPNLDTRYTTDNRSHSTSTDHSQYEVHPDQLVDWNCINHLIPNSGGILTAPVSTTINRDASPVLWNSNVISTRLPYQDACQPTTVHHKHSFSPSFIAPHFENQSFNSDYAEHSAHPRSFCSTSDAQHFDASRSRGYTPPIRGQRMPLHWPPMCWWPHLQDYVSPVDYPVQFQHGQFQSPYLSHPMQYPEWPAFHAQHSMCTCENAVHLDCSSSWHLYHSASPSTASPRPYSFDSRVDSNAPNSPFACFPCDQFVTTPFAESNFGSSPQEGIHSMAAAATAGTVCLEQSPFEPIMYCNSINGSHARLPCSFRNNACDAAFWSPPGFPARPSSHRFMTSNYHGPMPRSGSAGAGFACSPDSTSVGTVHPRATVRDPGVDHDSIYQQAPALASGQRSMFRPAAVGLPFILNRTNSNLSPPDRNPIRLATGNVRPMSNSFSANDLAVLRTHIQPDLRSTHSSFQLSPDLPFEPSLVLLDGSTFYSKIVQCIELDASLNSSIPSGWSERRSSFGRSYYTHDVTGKSSWHHPSLGSHVPLGWERIDSLQNGIYYQNLLIPHCQRYHPNLWMPAPLKNPMVESESFFSELRKLQSSLRHQLTEDCRELERYKATYDPTEEALFVDNLKQLDVETLVQMTRVLDRLFYDDLHAVIVLFEQQRMRVVSQLFAFSTAERIFPQILDQK